MYCIELVIENSAVYIKSRALGITGNLSAFLFSGVLQKSSTIIRYRYSYNNRFLLHLFILLLTQSIYTYICIFTRAIAWEGILGPKAIDEYPYTLVALVKSMLYIIINATNVYTSPLLFFIYPFFKRFDRFSRELAF